MHAFTETGNLFEVCGDPLKDSSLNTAVDRGCHTCGQPQLRITVTKQIKLSQISAKTQTISLVGETDDGLELRKPVLAMPNVVGCKYQQLRFLS